MHWITVSVADASSRDRTAAKKATFLWATTCCKRVKQQNSKLEQDGNMKVQILARHKFNTFPRSHMGDETSSQHAGVSCRQLLQLSGTLTSWLWTVPPQGVLVNDFGQRFSFLFFKGEILDVGDFSGESGLTEKTFLSISYRIIHHQPIISFKKVKHKKRHTKMNLLPHRLIQHQKVFSLPTGSADSRVCRTLKSSFLFKPKALPMLTSNIHETQLHKSLPKTLT